MVYRKDIDGLRAVAVLSVILFHAGVPGFSGGFVGVDVFFVISGYLICGLLYEEAGRTGRISIAGFYERRARRILPALILVMAVSSLLAVFTLLPFQLIDFGTNALGVATFLSNVTLWLQGGYFSGPAEENPLLHTWSLAVEEQFYIAFPLMMALVLRLKRRALLLALILLASLASIAIAEVGTRLAPTANFFLLPGRFWELGLGAMAALSVRGAPWGRPRLAADAVSLAGLAMILASVLAFDAVTPFPSLWAMLPTFGALLVILMAGPETFAGRLLASPPFVAVGLISYSAYLWHQPLFAFARIRSMDEPGTALMVALIATTLVLAAPCSLLGNAEQRERGRA